MNVKKLQEEIQNQIYELLEETQGNEPVPNIDISETDTDEEAVHVLVVTEHKGKKLQGGIRFNKEDFDEEFPYEDIAKTIVFDATMALKRGEDNASSN